MNLDPKALEFLREYLKLVKKYRMELVESPRLGLCLVSYHPEGPNWEKLHAYSMVSSLYEETDPAEWAYIGTFRGKVEDVTILAKVDEENGDELYWDIGAAHIEFVKEMNGNYEAP